MSYFHTYCQKFKIFVKNKLTMKNFFQVSKLPLPKSILSPVTLKNIIFGIKWGCYWGGLPYEYDIHKNILIITEKAVKIWKIVTFLQIINFLNFAGVVLFMVVDNGDVDSLAKNKNSLYDVAFGFIVTMLSLALIILNINIGVFKRTEFCEFINFMIHYYIFLKGNLELKF